MPSTIADALDSFGGLARRRDLARIVPRRELDAAIRAGTLHRTVHGWYTSDPRHPGAVAVAHGAGLGCVSALRSRKIWAGDDRRTHLHVPHSRAHRQFPPSIVAHWSRAPLQSWRSSTYEAVRQSARCLPRDHLVAAVDSALHTGALSIHEWKLLCERHPGTFAAIRHLVDPRAESGPETLVRLLLLDFRPQPQVRIGPYRVDLLIGRVAVEFDGFEFHRDKFEADRARDAALAAYGIRVLHFSYVQLMERPQEMVRAVAAAVAEDDRRTGAR